MGSVTFFVLCSFFVAVQGNGQRKQIQVTLEADRPSLRVPLHNTATLKCCYTASEEIPALIWIKHSVNSTEAMNKTTSDGQSGKLMCGVLTLIDVQLNHTGLYRCMLTHKLLKSTVYTHGTFLQVYKPMEKTINISESAKNKILTAEGILLLLCVLLPSASLLCKSKRLHELEKRKVNREEENIYQGLNLDDCCSTYDQILRSQVQNPYQDVDNVIPEEEEIQLEKP